MAYTGFSTLCRCLWASPVLELSSKPRAWVRELLDSLQSSSVARLLTVTRRSAGLPFFLQVCGHSLNGNLSLSPLQAILAAEPHLSGRACLKSCMEVLLRVAQAAISSSDDPAPLSSPPGGVTGCVASSSPASPPAAVHALNILRALYRDSRLGDHVVPFIPDGIKVAIAGFSASLWPVSVMCEL